MSTLCTRSLTRPLNKQQHRHRPAISSSSPAAAALQSHTEPLTFCTCAAAGLTASSISPRISPSACWSSAMQLARMCSALWSGKGSTINWGALVRRLLCTIQPIPCIRGETFSLNLFVEGTYQVGPAPSPTFCFASQLELLHSNEEKKFLRNSIKSF